MIRDILEVISRLSAVFRRRKLDQDFEDEFATHIELLADQNVRRGLDRHEARRQAIIQLGGLNAIKDLHREARGLKPIERFVEVVHGYWRDMVHASRALARARAFTFVCVLTLGIGMVPVIGIPYVTHVLRIPPRGVNADGLVELIMTSRGDLEDDWSYPGFMDLRSADTGIEITGWSTGQTEISNEKVPTLFVSANYFSTVGVKLARGRAFDESFGGPAVVVGYDFWQNRLGSDPEIIGKPLTLDAIAHVVVGIAPDRFGGHLGNQKEQLFVPLELHPRFRAEPRLRFNRDIGWINIHGRLKPGVSISQANAAVAAVTSRLSMQYPTSNEARMGSAEAYDPAGYAGRSELTVFQALLSVLTGLVLFVICLNISGMMQVRSAMRERELSVRQAVGASRGRLVRYLLSEAIILSGLGGVLGAVILFNLPPILAWWIGKPIPIEIQATLGPDLYMIAICVGLCLATSLLFGLLPALRFSRPAIISSLKDAAGGAGRSVSRVQRVAIALQVSLAMPLLVLSSMTIDRVRSTAAADLGFNTDGLAAVRVNLDLGKEKENPGFFVRSARDNLERTSGIVSATAADGLPLDFTLRFRRVSRQGETVFVRAQVTRVGEEYLKTMGIPLLRGRGITAEDGVGAELVTVVSKSLANRLFPTVDAGDVIGKRLTFAVEGRRDKSSAEAFTIVGVTADFAPWEISEDPEQLLLPLAQDPVSSIFLVARSSGGEQPTMLKATIENAVRNFDPKFKAADIVTGDQLRQRSMRKLLMNSAFTGVPGTIVLMLGALGIYGVIGLLVATRTREMAVRIAIGASPWDVVRMVLFDVMKLVTPGVVFGLVIALVLVRLGSVGPPVSSVEHLAYVVAAAIAVLVAALASLAPARRAASVAPMVAMRAE